MNILEREIGRVFYKPEPDIGGSSFTVRHPTLRETLFRVDLMMTYIDKPTPRIDILKSRYDHIRVTTSNTNDLTAAEFIDLTAKLLAKKLFGAHLKMFRVAFEDEIKQAVKQILLNHHKVGYL